MAKSETFYQLLPKIALLKSFGSAIIIAHLLEPKYEHVLWEL